MRLLSIGSTKKNRTLVEKNIFITNHMNFYLLRHGCQGVEQKPEAEAILSENNRK